MTEPTLPPFPRGDLLNEADTYDRLAQEPDRDEEDVIAIKFVAKVLRDAVRANDALQRQYLELRRQLESEKRKS